MKIFFETVKYIFLLFCFLSLSGLCAWSSEHFSHQERIFSFCSEIDVNSDSSVTVTEKIDVFSEQQTVKHGIKRNLPIIYPGRYGGVVSSGFVLHSAMIDGKTAEYHTERVNRQIHIYIGSRNNLLSSGIHHFTIIYSMKNMINFLDEYDELYWNVTGNEWTLPIAKAEVRITLPYESKFLQYDSWTGPENSRENQAEVSGKTGHYIIFRTTAPLPPGNGFTVTASWPEGLLKRPGRLAVFFRNNSSFITGSIGFLILLVYYFAAWKISGKDGEIDAIPFFAPPSGIGPATGRFLFRRKVDDISFAAAVTSIAVKGAMTIQRLDDVFFLSKKDNPQNQALTRGENALYKRLFRKSDKLAISLENWETIAYARRELERTVKRECAKVFFLYNIWWLSGGVLITACTFFFMAWSSPVRSPSMLLAVFTAPVAMAAGMAIIRFFNAVREIIRKFFSHVDNGRIAFFNIILALVYTACLIPACIFFLLFMGLSALCIYLLILGVNVLFFHIINVPNLYGRRVCAVLEGFKTYLLDENMPVEEEEEQQRDKNMLDRLGAYLPWAIALEADREWTRHFQKILKDLDENAPYSQERYPLTYYRTLAVPGAVTTMTTQISSAGMTAPGTGTDSASSGGGVSGGGGGGGGGSGW